MEPQTGKIIAIANYPSFDPNNYNQVFDKEIVNLSTEQISELIPENPDDPAPKSFILYRNKETFDKILIFKEVDSEGRTIYKRFKNYYGPEVYQNKAVSWIYEPGSVMKSVAMAIGIDDNDVSPNETFLEDGPIKVDEFEIRNSLDKYRGIQTMTNVLEQSSNTGMAYVARKVGRTLLYNYYKKFGFGERTDIEFDNEHPGQMEHSSQWAESELVTRAFGQGITVTPLQMVTAYAALANGGVMMKPYIVDEISKEDGTVIKTEPKILHRVIDQETSETITSMLVSAVENGVAKGALVDGYYLAGKTGTSQTYKHGKPLEGPGTTIASFAGYGPVSDPKFVILIKIDRPRKEIWGSTVAAPLFADLASYLFKYYSIPKEK
jgi:cell division protein FtsI/penicillin-binding protein 2